MKIDHSKFFEIRSDKRRKQQVVTIRENGDIHISKIIREKLDEKSASIYISKNYKTLILDPAGSELKVKSNGLITAKNDIDQFDRKKVIFPLIFQMKWDEADGAWIGELQMVENIISRRTKKSEALETIIR